MQKTAELEQLKKKIASLQASLAESQSHLSAQDIKLKTIDLQINDINAKLRSLARERQSIEQELENLENRKQEINIELSKEQQILGQHLRSAYISGHEEYLKLIMNQQDPAYVSRMLVYYRFMTEDRVRTIARINDYLGQLDVLEAEIQLRSRELLALIEKQEEKHRALTVSYREQLSIVNDLRSVLTGKEQEISQLQRDEKELLGLIDKLREVLDELLDEEKNAISFRDFRGRLKLPADAKVKIRYGTFRDIGNLRWNGVVLAGKLGSEVRAIFHGRVVYADWMRGFGLLLIIDHGDSYMSLYGQNESLLVEEGDWVETGQAIATMGKSGGGSEPGLYFEIRYRGRPQNPLLWAKR